MFYLNFSIGQVQFESSNLPILIIETQGQEIVDDPKITAELKVLNSGNSERNYLNSTDFTFNNYVGIEFRGNTSQGFPKKSYGMELRDDNGANLNFPLLGLPTENDWILYAPYTDKTMMRNVLAFDLARKTGHYASRTAYCELVINGEYQGVYILMEKIKRDKNRVDISKLNEDENSGEDVTGGYIIKIDNPTGTFCSAWEPPGSNFHIQFEYPTCELITAEQEDYIKNYVLSFESSLNDFSANQTNRSYINFADEQSIIDCFIINELTKNIDAYMLSSFLYKDKNGKLNFGPIWDYNLSFGNASLREGFETKGFQQDINIGPWWWEVMLSDPIIQTRIENRWCELRSNEFSTDSIMKSIDVLTARLAEAEQRNFERWPIEGEYIWPNYFVGETYEEEVIYFRHWINQRLAWLDETLNCKTIETNVATVYPNPFTGIINCNLNVKDSDKVSVYLYDLNGKMIAILLKDELLTSAYWEFNWDGSTLLSGVYFLHVQFGSTNIQTIKLIKL